MTSDVTQTISSYWLGPWLTGTMSRIPQGGWKPPADNGASGWHRPAGPRQNNAAAAGLGPAEGNSLLPGCLRGGTLKQWKFPSTKGEQKKRCWKLLLRRDSFFQGLTEERRFPQLTETHSALQDVILREVQIKNYSLTKHQSLETPQYSPLEHRVEHTAVAKGPAQARDGPGSSRAPHSRAGHQTPAARTWALHQHQGFCTDLEFSRFPPVIKRCGCWRNQFTELPNSLLRLLFVCNRSVPEARARGGHAGAQHCSGTTKSPSLAGLTLQGLCTWRGNLRSNPYMLDENTW